MTEKIKVVQIAMTEADGDVYTEYLDDQGRIWYQTSKWVYPEGKPTDYKNRKWVTTWHQIDLPDEPVEATSPQIKVTNG